MALLKGFPPSNTITPDQPSRFECELCGQEFWQSFPLGLCLRINDQVNFDILACRECWSADQGKTYWGPEVNRWGDQFTVYSKAREGRSFDELVKAHADHRRLCLQHKSARVAKVKFNKGDLKSFDAFYKKIDFALTGFWSVFRQTGTPEAKPPRKLILWAGKLCEMFDGHENYKSHKSPYEGKFKNKDWTWLVRREPLIPDRMRAIFLEEVFDIDVCDVPLL